ncbi:MAG: hypothetical protein JO030_01735 [Candidatus Eremiobacteraeota bacterium]|nr:hypothetical protein [Candidatus Eremiobacteraeota bacterium]
MRLRNLVLPAVSGSIAATLAGCSSSGQLPFLAGAPPPIAANSGAALPAPKPFAYVGDQASSFIAVFDSEGKAIRRITRGLRNPAGILVDRDHDLWVANQGDSNVLEFARGATKPMLTLPDGASNAPSDVAMCRDGTIFVANIVGGIAKYVGRKHHAAGSLAYGSAAFTNVTCDDSANVFATAVVGTSGTVVVFPHGQQYGAHSLPIFSSKTLGGIKADRAGNIVVSDAAGHVTEYTEQGYPTGVTIATPDRWVDIALDDSGKLLLAGDQTKNAGVTVTFPGGKTRGVYKAKFSRVLGVAFDS